MRYFIRFSYVGSDFHGSQCQPNGTTVQEVMERALSTILRVPTPLTFAGRTDAGVHAKEMFAHFDWPTTTERNSEKYSTTSLTGRLNHLLPHSIAVHDILPVHEDAHARFSAVQRTYEYHVALRKNPFTYLRATLLTTTLDFQKMNSAATLLLGKHDFAAFCKAHTDVKTTLCTVNQARWTYNNEHACFTIAADRFLRNMVRAIVGTLWEVGRGRMNEDQFQQVIKSLNRCQAAQSAPPEGLYLTKITYPEQIFLNEKITNNSII